MQDFPGIVLAALVQRRGRNHVAAIAANVETDTERLDPVLDVGARVGKEILDTAAASQLQDCFRQRTIGLLQLDTALVTAFVAVLIEHGQAGDGTRRNADIPRRELRPPSAYGGLVGRRILETMLG